MVKSNSKSEDTLDDYLNKNIPNKFKDGKWHNLSFNFRYEGDNMEFQQVIPPEPTQDTSLDARATLSRIGLSHKVTDKYGSQFIAYGDCIDDIMAWHKSEQAKLLQVIEDEVVGQDVVTNPNPEIPEGTNETYDIQCYNRVGANDLRNKQRQALKQIKERL